MSKTDKTAERMAAVVAPIIEAIESGLADPKGWKAPWHNADPLAFAAYNPVTERNYTGGNRWVLAAEVMFGNAEPYWATYKHWASLSKHAKACTESATGVGTRKEKRPNCGDDCHIVNVRKGAKATFLFRPRLINKEDEKTGETRRVPIGFAVFPVFHSGDVDGWIAPPVEKADTGVCADTVAAAFDFVRGAGAKLRLGDYGGAFYTPLTDTITLPDVERWLDADGAWATAAHELVHWTGHESRLNRSLLNRFGSEAYAAEELVAEMGAAFTLARLGRSAEPREDHAKYLANWLKVLKEDPKHLWTVASHAEKAADFVIAATAATEAAPTLEAA